MNSDVTCPYCTVQATIDIDVFKSLDLNTLLTMQSYTCAACSRTSFMETKLSVTSTNSKIDGK